MASLLTPAATAPVKGQLASQLQAALAHRWLIERAKGMVMGREGLDAQAASERLRQAARSSSRRLADVASEVTAGKPLRSRQRTTPPAPADPCGRILVRASAIHGRSDDVLSLPARDGGRVDVHPLQFALLTRDPQVREFQVVQDGPVLRILIVPSQAPAAGGKLKLVIADPASRPVHTNAR